jgi:hypothetical protein
MFPKINPVEVLTMKTNVLLNSNIRETARKNTRLTQKFAKNLQKLSGDPIRLYEGPISANEDCADYVKLGAIKAVRLG